MYSNAYDCRSVKPLSELFKLLAEPNRLKILCSLGLECRPVSDIIEATGLSQTNVSFHLRALREAGLVRPDRRGAFIYYCLPDPELLRLLGDFRGWMEDHGNSNDDAPQKKKASRR
ncbi:MAG TPA: ArsR family transcriptional regulator [Chromatiales bacterium]|nr:ArsR family transcriptional regulator [Chromatiales bacterium]HEX22644.1 ArsR family transcriptional regulator [Chromatiales bacterium]